MFVTSLFEMPFRSLVAFIVLTSYAAYYDCSAVSAKERGVERFDRWQQFVLSFSSSSCSFSHERDP